MSAVNIHESEVKIGHLLSFCKAMKSSPLLGPFRSTGGPRLVQILGPGKNRASEICTSGYYIANFH